MSGGLGGVLKYHPLPGGPVPGKVHLHLLIQPLLREGMALHEAVQGKDHARYAPVVPFGGKGVGELPDAAAVIGRGHGLLQSLVYHLLLPLVREYLELRRYVQQVEELPDHLRAEAVHRADMGLV